MKVLEAERVTRLHVEFDERETAHLKKLRFFPPEAQSPARLWVTLLEIEAMEERGEIAAGTLEALPLKMEVRDSGEVSLQLDEKVIPVRDGDVLGRLEPSAKA